MGLKSTILLVLLIFAGGNYLSYYTLLILSPCMHIILIGKEYNDSMKGAKNMELAKITSKGQITIPIQIRRKLNLKDGDKVVFIEQDGKIVIENSTRVALTEAQDAFRGEAERLGLNTEQDVVDMVKQIRREIQEEKNADNA